MRAHLYVRVSEDKTGEELGVTRQRDDSLTLARQRGWIVAREHPENDTSAAGHKLRPEFEALLTAVAAGEVDAIIAWSLDRLTRNRRDTVRLIEACEPRRVVIALVRGSDLDMSTPAGRLTADILAGVARHEIEQKSGSPGTDVDHPGDFSWGRSSSMGPQESMTRASAALAEWKP